MSETHPKGGAAGTGGRQGRGGVNRARPALEELGPNFTRRLSELFRRRGRGAGDEPPRPPSGRGIGGGAGALALLAVAVWLASGFYLVVQGTRGGVLTLGKLPKETSSGPNWRPARPIPSEQILQL